MKKFLFFIIVVIFFMPILVLADEEVHAGPEYRQRRIELIRGKSYFLSYTGMESVGSCVSDSVMFALEVDGGCLRTNISGNNNSVEVALKRQGTRRECTVINPETRERLCRIYDVFYRYIISFSSDSYSNNSREVFLPEIVYQINDSNNVIRNNVIKQLEDSIEKPDGATNIVLNAASTSDALYISAGWNNDVELLKLDYDADNSLLSYNSLEEESIPVASIVTYGVRDWINKVSPNYDLAEEILNDSNKNKYVNTSSLGGFQSEHKLAGGEFNFKFSTTGEFNNLVVQQYQNNSPKAPTESIVPEEEESGSGTIPNPGSGEFLEIVTIVLLAVVGVFIVIKNKRTFTKL